MSMSYWEFCTYVVQDVQREAQVALGGGDMTKALKRIDRMCTEADLAYEDGERCEDSDLRSRLTRHYGRPMKLTWDRS